MLPSSSRMWRKIYFLSTQQGAKRIEPEPFKPLGNEKLNAKFWHKYFAVTTNKNVEFDVALCEGLWMRGDCMVLNKFYHQKVHSWCLMWHNTQWITHMNKTEYSWTSWQNYLTAALVLKLLSVSQLITRFCSRVSLGFLVIFQLKRGFNRRAMHELRWFKYWSTHQHKQYQFDLLKRHT